MIDKLGVTDNATRDALSKLRILAIVNIPGGTLTLADPNPPAAAEDEEPMTSDGRLDASRIAIPGLQPAKLIDDDGNDWGSGLHPTDERLAGGDDYYDPQEPVEEMSYWDYFKSAVGLDSAPKDLEDVEISKNMAIAAAAYEEPALRPDVINSYSYKPELSNNVVAVYVHESPYPYDTPGVAIGIKGTDPSAPLSAIASGAAQQVRSAIGMGELLTNMEKLVKSTVATVREKYPKYHIDFFAHSHGGMLAAENADYEKGDRAYGSASWLPKGLKLTKNFYSKKDPIIKKLSQHISEVNKDNDVEYNNGMPGILSHKIENFIDKETLQKFEKDLALKKGKDPKDPTVRQGHSAVDLTAIATQVGVEGGGLYAEYKGLAPLYRKLKYRAGKKLPWLNGSVEPPRLPAPTAVSAPSAGTSVLDMEALGLEELGTETSVLGSGGVATAEAFETAAEAVALSSPITAIEYLSVLALARQTWEYGDDLVGYAKHFVKHMEDAYKEPSNYPGLKEVV